MRRIAPHRSLGVSLWRDDKGGTTFRMRFNRRFDSLHCALERRVLTTVLGC